MPDYTRGLIPLDVSPLMQVFAQQEQRRMYQEDKKRQEKIDATNATTATLQQDILRERLKEMQQAEPEGLANLVYGSTAMMSAGEVLFGSDEAGADRAGSGALADLDAGYQMAMSGAPAFAQPILKDAYQMFRSGDIEGGQERIQRLTQLTGTAVPFLGEIEAQNQLERAMSGQVAGEELGTPRLMIHPETDEITTVFDTSQGWVNARREPVDTPEGAIILNSASYNPTERGDLPRGKIVEIKDMSRKVINFNLMVNDTLDLLENNPDVNTWAGGVSSFVNDVRANISSVLNRAGVEVEGGLSIQEMMKPSKYEDTFRELGVENELFKSYATGLAFQAASITAGQEGRSVSNVDVQQFLQVVGRNTSDPVAIKNNLRAVAVRATREFTTDAEVYDYEYEGDLGLEKILERTRPPGGAQDTTAVDVDFEGMSVDDLLNLDLSELSTEQLNQYLELMNNIGN